jgi:RNA polymerase sigma-70 factor (ECF subfamily)
MTVEELVLEYNSMLYKNCMVILCNEQDAQDAVQDTFCRYIERTPDFKDKEHEKAWLMRVATNRCIDIHRFRAKHPIADIEETKACCEMPEQSEVLTALTRLPAKIRTVIYLHYIEGYKTAEIAEMLGISVNAVKKRLQRGRELLKRTLTVAAVFLAIGLICIPVRGQGRFPRERTSGKHVQGRDKRYC